MRLPRIITQIVDSESKSVTFGWTLSIAAHAFFFFRPELFKIENWMAAQGAAAALVAQKSIKEGFIEHATIKAGAEDAPAAPAATPPAGA